MHAALGRSGPFLRLDLLVRGYSRPEFLVASRLSKPGIGGVVDRVTDSAMSPPQVGGFIADCLEDKVNHLMKDAFRWRPETAINRKWEDREGRFGPEGSNRI